MVHPEVCYVFIPTENSVGIVKWGERGYYPTDYPHNYTAEIVAEMNEGLGFSAEEIRAMQICSMANIPETEEAWEKHYAMVKEALENRS